jgi:hypothetical protein
MIENRASLTRVHQGYASGDVKELIVGEPHLHAAEEELAEEG